MTIRKPGETLRLVTALAVAVFLIACGGGGGISPPPPPPPPPGDNITVSVAPGLVSLVVGNTQQFTATVTGTSNTSVTWSVNGIQGGNPTVGTITPAGLYAAPSAVPSPNPVSIAATSQADSTKSASASVTILPSGSSGLSSMSPIVAMQGSGGFTLTVNGSAFSSSSQVVFNGAPRPTTFVNSAQLTAQISVSDLSSPGIFAVKVQTGGQSAGPLSFFVVPRISPQSVPVSSEGNTNVNIEVSTVSSPLLSFIAAGTCMGSRCSAGGTGAEVKIGQAVPLFLVGNGIVPGTFFIVSGNAGDVSVTQPLAGDFPGTDSGRPAARVRISVSPSAAVGPRNILVTNVAGEIAVFVGGLLITSGP